MSPKMESKEYNEFQAINLELRMSVSVDKRHENISDFVE
jgi:hypothetical protein